MSLDIVLLALRILIAVVLYAFLGTLFVYIWRDMRAISRQIDVSQRATGRLVVVDCGADVPLENGISFPLRPVTTIGRSPTNTIVLPDTFASTEHARIEAVRGQWWLEDRQSRNGTRLNNVPISGRVVLSSGDVISIGRIGLRFEAD